MNAALLEQIAEAVLYEGYVLYPYRPSSRKNRRERFSFGRVYPETYSLAQGGAEPFVMQTECLAKATSDSPQLRVSVRFLQPLAREIGVLEPPLDSFWPGAEPTYKVVPELRVGDQVFQSWQEALERKVEPPAVALGSGSSPLHFPFQFFASRDLEPIRDGGRAVGIISRKQEALKGAVEIEARWLPGGLRKITVRVLNHTPLPEPLDDPEAVALRTFASTHTVLNIEGGQFVSLMDPPAEAKGAAASCRNLGTWPVLAGDEAKGERDVMLSSPIILYDYPKIAPESAGPLFDGTEIDEILTLRILTMTDQEKAEMRSAEEHVRRLLERTESLPEGAMLRLHGAMRKPQPGAPLEYDDFFGASTRLAGVTVDGVYLRAGDRVRIRPKARADIMDMALSGQIAVIEAVEQDLEKRVHLALVLENDPGKDLGLMRQPGHRFFYGIDEVQPLQKEESGCAS